MPSTLLIKNVPDDVVSRLKGKARLHRRSLQRELLSIVENAVNQPRTLSPNAVLAEVRRLGLKTPADSVEIIRASRDSAIRS